MKKSINKTICSALLAASALVVASSVANAAGFAVREQSAMGQGASFAGIAAGGSDLSSMFFNPATITQHEGLQFEGNAGLIIPYSKVKDGRNIVPVGAGTNSGNIGKFAVVPSTYASYQFNDNLFLGFTANSPFGLVTKGDANWAGSYYGIKSDVFMIQAGPVVGWKVNDMISVAAAVRGAYSTIELTTNGGGLGIVRLKGKDWAVNYSLGLTFKPTSSTTIGIGYNSQTDFKYDGSIKYGNVLFAPFLNTDITSKLTTPGTLNVGLRQKVGEDFTVLLGFEWADWSQLKELRLKSKTAIPVPAPTAFNWKDSYFYSIGGEYKVNDMMTARAGFAYEQTSVPDSTRAVRIPDADRYWLSIGGSVQVNDHMRATIGYTHIISKTGKVNLPLNPALGLPGLNANFKQHVDIISLSGTYKF